METDRDNSLEKAIQAAQSGELARAEHMLEALLARDPSAARTHNALGVVRLQMGKPDAAEASLLRCLQLSPDDPKVHINLGKLYSSSRHSAAEKHFRQAISLDPASAMASFNLGILLLGQGRAAEAREEFSRAVALDPGDAEAQVRLATLLLQELKFEEAEDRFRDAIRLQPDLAEAHNNLALILLETGRLGEAQEACQEAVRISPGYLRAWSNYVMYGQYDSAASDDDLVTRARRAGRAMETAAGRFATSPALERAKPYPGDRLRRSSSSSGGSSPATGAS
jgi:Tfp pilus assembly protein PilF